jgi:hypothetical protein
MCGLKHSVRIQGLNAPSLLSTSPEQTVPPVHYALHGLTSKSCFFKSSKADCCHFERERCQISCLLISCLLVLIKGTSSMWMLCKAKSVMHVYMLSCMQTVNTLTTSLSAANFKVTSLHGKRSQQERTSALNAFKSGKVNILVATDVAARGLHIPRLPYIVNYDFPGNLETYIHRVGRTGTLCFAPTSVSQGIDAAR